MPFELPPLPFALDALEPHMSQETVQVHYEKHHRGYANKLNELIQGTPFTGLTPEQIIKKSAGKIFNNAAQAWNHTFFWKCLTPKPSEEGQRHAREALGSQFGSLEHFQEEFSKKAEEFFGSGWIWLARGPRGHLAIETQSNAGNPLRNGKRPILTLDLWEHAYYLDHKNERAKYIESFWRLVNWDFVMQNIRSSSQNYSLKAV